MRRIWMIGCFALGIASWVAGAEPSKQAGPVKQDVRIVAGPNILVSRDGDFPHVETILAANPKDVKNLVGGAMTFTSRNGDTACRTYTTTDGGATWWHSEFAEQVEWGGGDPYVAFTPQGTAIFSALAFVKDEKDQTRAFLHVWRSEDGGRSWGKTMNLGSSYDHEQIAVDHTKGEYAGRIYIGVLWDYPIYRIGVFRSDDDGRSWTGPVEAANGGGTIGLNEGNLMVLSDGTLVVPYVDFEFLPDKVKHKGKASSNTFVALSPDGGVTFGAPRKVQTIQYDLDDPDLLRAATFPSLAADNQSNDFKDQIYMAWTDFRHGRARVLFSRSEDRGLRWSEPLLLDGNIPKEAMQYQPVVAANKEGVVAVTWYDTRDSKDGSQFHQFFSASIDGGKSFLPPLRISSAPSTPEGAGNMIIRGSVFRDNEASYLSLHSAASRWVSGGDYMGLVADRDAVFHPFWADARSGTFQIYTAAVSVLLPPKEETAAPAPPPPPRTKVILDTRVDFLLDPTRYDGGTREAEIPVRLTNVSKQAIYPPIIVEVLGFGLDDPEIPKDEDEVPPVVLNAANGKQGEGAIFDFSDALGSLESLKPGAQTGAVVVRLKFQNPKKVPVIRLKVEGMVEEEK